MTPSLERIAEVMQTIADDAETDALCLNTVAFTARGVGEQLGAIYAAIQALAKAVKVLTEHERECETCNREGASYL